ncbi:MAG: AmmeMemoRadiSam system protein A [Patescibacteria group bacterium]
MDKYVALAKKTIEAFIKTGQIIKVPADLPEGLLKEKAGVFVSLHRKSDRSLRGCIGTFQPTKENIALEIISNAVSAAFRDPRFNPIKSEELEDLEINVDVLTSPEPVDDIKLLDAKKYGVIVKTEDGRAGLLLPDLEGVESPQEQIDICGQKGGIDPENEKISLLRFRVERHK